MYSKLVTVYYYTPYTENKINNLQLKIFNIESIRGAPPKLKFIYKNYVFILTYETLVIFKVLSIWYNTTIEIFFHYSKLLLNSSILMSFSVSAIFCCTSSTPGKTFPFGECFHLGKQKKVAWSEVRWIVRAEPIFWSKIAEHSARGGKCTPKLPIVKQASVLRESSKNLLKSMQPTIHNTTSRYTDTEGLLEHSPSGGSLYYKGSALQKVIFFWGSSPFIWFSCQIK